SWVYYYPRSMPTDFVQQWLVSVQHEFAGGILLDGSLVHTHGNNLVFSTDIDEAPLSALGCTGYNCGNPNPVFNSIIAQLYNGWSNFNALQLRLQKRMSYGLNFQVNYMWSKSMDTGTGNGHGSTIDIYQNATTPPPITVGRTSTRRIPWSVRSSTNCRSAARASLNFTGRSTTWWVAGASPVFSSGTRGFL